MLVYYFQIIIIFYQNISIFKSDKTRAPKLITGDTLHYNSFIFTLLTPVLYLPSPSLGPIVESRSPNASRKT